MQIATCCTWVCLVICLSAPGPCAAAQKHAEHPGDQKAGRDRLLAGLQVRYATAKTADRASQQIALLPVEKSVSPAVVRNIIQQFQEEWSPAPLPPSFVAAISSQGEFAVPELIRELQQAKPSDEAYLLILSSLGRMGTNAAEARPLLRRTLASDATAPRFRAALRAVLANIGDAPADIQRQIEDDLGLKDAEVGGVWSNRDYYLHVMALMRPRGEWLNKGVISQLTSILRDPVVIRNEASSNWLHYTAITLGVSELNKDAERSVAESLERALDDAYQRNSARAVDVALALARRRPERTRAIVERLFAAIAKNPEIAPGPLACMESAYLLVNDAIAKVSAEMLSSDNQRLFETATFFLMASGLAARAAAPSVLDFVKREADETRRYNAAVTLEYIADLSIVGKLESAARAEMSKRISDALARAIKASRVDKDWKEN